MRLAGCAERPLRWLQLFLPGAAAPGATQPAASMVNQIRKRRKFVSDELRKMEMTIRLNPTEAERLRELAHAARLPRAVFARRKVLGELVVDSAPPLELDLPESARAIVKIISATNSNLSQLSGHAGEAGEGSPLFRLAGPQGHLTQLQSQLLDIGMKLKRGHFIASKTDEIHPEFEYAAEQLNALALNLNKGQLLHHSAWAPPLNALAKAIGLVS